MKIQYPNGTFTVNDLVNANNNIKKSSVVSELYKLIDDGRVIRSGTIKSKHGRSYMVYTLNNTNIYDKNKKFNKVKCPPHNTFTMKDLKRCNRNVRTATLNRFISSNTRNGSISIVSKYKSNGRPGFVFHKN